MEFLKDAIREKITDGWSFSDLVDRYLDVTMVTEDDIAALWLEVTGEPAYW